MVYLSSMRNKGYILVISFLYGCMGSVFLFISSIEHSLCETFNVFLIMQYLVFPHLTGFS